LTGEGLAQRGTERVELVLEEEQRPGVVAQDAGPANLPSEHQERPAHHERRHHRPRLDRHHPLPARASSTRGRSRSRAAARASAAGRYAPAARAPARPPAPPAPPPPKPPWLSCRYEPGGCLRPPPCARARARFLGPAVRRCPASCPGSLPSLTRTRRRPDQPARESTPRINASWPLRIAAGLKSPTFLLPTNR